MIVLSCHPSLLGLVNNWDFPHSLLTLLSVFDQIPHRHFASQNEEGLPCDDKILLIVLTDDPPGTTLGLSSFMRLRPPEDPGAEQE